MLWNLHVTIRVIDHRLISCEACSSYGHTEEEVIRKWNCRIEPNHPKELEAKNSAILKWMKDNIQLIEYVVDMDKFVPNVLRKLLSTIKCHDLWEK